MGLEKLVQRGSVYGFGAGIVTTGVVVLVAGLFDVVLAVVLLVLSRLRFWLSSCCWATGGGPGPSGEEMGAGETANPVESGSSMSPADMEAVVPATRLEYIMYFMGFGVTAAVILAFFLR
jgi:hypothetical protein